MIIEQDVEFWNVGKDNAHVHVRVCSLVCCESCGTWMREVRRGIAEIHTLSRKQVEHLSWMAGSSELENAKPGRRSVSDDLVSHIEPVMSGVLCLSCQLVHLDVYECRNFRS